MAENKKKMRRPSFKILRRWSKKEQPQPQQEENNNDVETSENNDDNDINIINKLRTGPERGRRFSLSSSLSSNSILRREGSYKVKKPISLRKVTFDEESLAEMTFDKFSSHNSTSRSRRRRSKSPPRVPVDNNQTLEESLQDIFAAPPAANKRSLSMGTASTESDLTLDDDDRLVLESSINWERVMSESNSNLQASSSFIGGSSSFSSGLMSGRFSFSASLDLGELTEQREQEQDDDDDVGKNNDDIQDLSNGMKNTSLLGGDDSKDVADDFDDHLLHEEKLDNDSGSRRSQSYGFDDDFNTAFKFDTSFVDNDEESLEHENNMNNNQHLDIDFNRTSATAFEQSLSSILSTEEILDALPTSDDDKRYHNSAAKKHLASVQEHNGAKEEKEEEEIDINELLFHSNDNNKNKILIDDMSNNSSFGNAPYVFEQSMSSILSTEEILDSLPTAIEDDKRYNATGKVVSAYHRHNDNAALLTSVQEHHSSHSSRCSSSLNKTNHSFHSHHSSSTVTRSGGGVNNGSNGVNVGNGSSRNSSFNESSTSVLDQCFD